MKPITLLKFEGLAELVISIISNQQLGYSWWLFALLFLAPDLFILGYLLNKETGAVIYNIGHTYSVVVCIGILAWVYHQPIGLSISLIWAAHIGFDRLLGYGLKYTSRFKTPIFKG